MVLVVIVYHIGGHLRGTPVGKASEENIVESVNSGGVAQRRLLGHIQSRSLPANRHQPGR